MTEINSKSRDGELPQREKAGSGWIVATTGGIADAPEHDLAGILAPSAVRRADEGDLLGDKYRLLRPLGAGGMGIIWLARHEDTGAHVAVKLLGAKFGQAELRRLWREARALGQLEHSNIVRVQDVVRHAGGGVAVVMEYLRGEPLDSYLTRHPSGVSLDEALAIVLPILGGLQHAHDHGIVHRDVKPSNIFLAFRPGVDGAVPTLLDFGACRSTSEVSTGAWIGTPLFMSPEQLDGDVVDIRADIFAVALVLHLLLTGEHPFGPHGRYRNRFRTAEVDPRIEAPVRAELERALAKDPSVRHATPKELADALRQAAPPLTAVVIAAVEALASGEVPTPDGVSRRYTAFERLRAAAAAADTAAELVPERKDLAGAGAVVAAPQPRRWSRIRHALVSKGALALGALGLALVLLTVVRHRPSDKEALRTPTPTTTNREVIDMPPLQVISETNVVPMAITPPAPPSNDVPRLPPPRPSARPKNETCRPACGPRY